MKGLDSTQAMITIRLTSDQRALLEELCESARAAGLTAVSRVAYGALEQALHLEVEGHSGEDEPSDQEKPANQTPIQPINIAPERGLTSEIKPNRRKRYPSAKKIHHAEIVAWLAHGDSPREISNALKVSLASVLKVAREYRVDIERLRKKPEGVPRNRYIRGRFGRDLIDNKDNTIS